MKRKLISLMLCTAMAATLVAGCGGNDKPSNGSGKDSGTTEDAGEEGKESEDSGNAANSEPMHISVAGYFFGPVDESKDEITPEIERRLLEDHGINVELEPVYIEYANYAELLNTRLAGGTAPDVFLAQSDVAIQTYYDQGVIKTWSEEFFKENAPDVYEFIMNGGPRGEYKDYLDMWRKFSFKGEDEMAVIAAIKPEGMIPYKQYVYRGDWLENLGVTEDQLPKTVDEFIELMRRFTFEDPDGNGVDDTYGCSVTGLRGIFGAYGLANGFIDSTTMSYWHEQDGQIVNEDITDNAREVVKIIRQMYEEGLIDPEFVTGKESIPGAYWGISDGFMNGRYGVTALVSVDHFRYKGVLGPEDMGGNVAQEYWAVNGEDSTFVYGPWITGPDGEYGSGIGIPITINESALYNADMDDEKLAVIFQILNAFATDDGLYKLAACGVEGEHYTVNEDGAVIQNAEKYDQAGLNEVGVAAVRSLYGADRAFSETAYDIAFYNAPSWAFRLEWLSKPQFGSHIENAVYEALPSQGDLGAEVNTYRDETWVKMITGELDPEEDWDNFVSTYLSIGGQTLQDEANEWYSGNK